MDIKINGSRVKNLLNYDWLKIVLAIVAGFVVWSLLFTTLGTRITVGEEFIFQIYENVYTQGNSNNSVLLENLKKEEYFSYDVLETNVGSLSSAGHYSAAYMLSLRVATQEGDVMLISDGRADKVTEERDPTAEIRSVINAGYMYNIDKFLSSARTYCVDNGFIIEGQDGNWSVDDKKIEEYFLTVRLKSAGNYRKTYRTEAQKADAVKKEIARITSIYENYLFVSNAISVAKEQGNDFLWYGDLYKYDESGKVIEGETETYPFGIDLYKLNQPFIEDGVKKVSDTWYTMVDGKTTAEGLVFMVFNFESHQKDLQYESLAFLRYIIETYSRY